MRANEFVEKGMFDVVVCGGGLAGQTLARQLRLEMPNLSVAVIDKLKRPLPDAAFKVGESTVETGSYYLYNILQLEDYFDQNHIRKLGLRFYFGGGNGAFHERPEFGLSRFATVKSYQIDRGVLENDLRRFNEEAGVEVLEGCSVKAITLANGQGNGKGNHVVTLAGEDGNTFDIKTRWVVDAMGRRRYLQKKLNLTRTHEKKCSAVWFRYGEQLDVADLVPSEAQEWHERVPEKNRYLATNHFMGNGYWVWFIPLSSEATSVGIVALEDLHPFEEFHNYDLAMQWLQRHEPTVAGYLKDRTPLDFKCMRNYSFSSRQLFSTDRWAIVGDAGMFPDPFYALGADLISIGNCFITEMVKRDRNGGLTEDTVAEFNQFILSLNQWVTSNVQLAYPFFGNGLVMTAKLIWDFAAGWAHLGPQLFNKIFLDEEKKERIREATGNFFFLTRRMQQLFRDKDIQLRNLRPDKSLDELVDDQIKNMQLLEELAQALFLTAVEDVMPERLADFPEPIWLNAWSVSLNPDRWSTERLFEPTSTPRDLRAMHEQISRLYYVKESVA